MTDKKILTMCEASQYTGLTVGYLYKLTSARKIPFSKPFGKKCYFDRDALDTLFLSNPVKTNEELESAASTHVATA